MAFPGFPAPWHAVCLFWGNSPEFPHAYRSPLHGEARRVPVARFRGGAVFRHLRFRRHRHAVRRDRRDPRTVRPASLENHRGRMGAGCHLGPPVHGAADPAHRGSAGAAGRLSGHGPRHRRFRGVRAVQPLERHPPRHRERRHGLPHQAHLEQARPAPCPRGRQPHGLQGRGLPPRIPLRTRRLRFRGVQVRRCRGRLGGRQDLAHRRRAFRLLSGALGLVHAGPAGQGPAPPLCRRRVSVFHLS